MSRYDEIEKFLIKTYSHDEIKIKKPITEIADNNHIKGNFEAFDFDAIKEQILPSCDSADALYMNKWINFIEFKTGFALEKNDINAKTHKENLQLKIRLKAYESMSLFEKVIMEKAKIPLSTIEDKRRFVAVIDCATHADDASVDAIADLSGITNTTGFKSTLHKWLNNSLALYRRESDGKHIFYDETQVWYDYEFEKNIKIL